MTNDSIWSRIKLGFFLAAILALVIFVYRNLLKIISRKNMTRQPLGGSPEKNVPKIEKQEPKKEKKSKNFGNLFEEDITNLFTVIAAIGALISLFPIFSEFLLGPSWLNVLLSTELGFFALIMLLIAFYSGGIFMLIILYSMLRIVYSKIFETDNYSDPEKIKSSLLMLVGAISVFALVLFIFFIWLAKFDFAIYYTLLFLILIGESIGVIALYLSIILSIPSKIFKYIALVILTVVLLPLCVYYLVPFTFGMVTDISHYYSDKTIIVKIKEDRVDQNNQTPVLIHLNKSIDAYLTNNLTVFDLGYAQCHWSSSYGHFITISSNYSLIQTQSGEFIIPGCGDPKDKIYWTYDVGDFGKNKPPVIIGLTLEDRNKKINNILGYDRIFLNWTSTDYVKIENENFSRPL